jgi:hypothetical protein
VPLLYNPAIMSSSKILIGFNRLPHRQFHRVARLVPRAAA